MAVPELNRRAGFIDEWLAAVIVQEHAKAWLRDRRKSRKPQLPRQKAEQKAEQKAGQSEQEAVV